MAVYGRIRPRSPITANAAFTILTDGFARIGRHSHGGGNVWRRQNCVLRNATHRARSRARLRARPAPNLVRLAQPEPLQLTAGDVVAEDSEEAPFAPPPVDDIFGLGECEAEDVFVEAPVGLEAEEEDAPFDPPEFEAEPAFSPPVLDPAPQVIAPPPAPKPLSIEAPRLRAVPAISIYASWDRPEAEALLRDFAADPRLARAETQIARGGLDGATAHFAGGANADLVILDTTLQGKPMLAELDRLIEVLPPKARIVVIGAVNDIGLLRELAARDVSDYVVPPAKADDLVRSTCQLFAAADSAHVIAVIGARGGIGASTIAQNVAWSIAERQRANVALVDLDFSFGSAAQNFQHQPTASAADVVQAEDPESALAQALTKLTPRLQLLSAPAAVGSVELDTAAFEAMMAEVRRASSYVVLDLPHVWEPWVRSALRDSDEVVVVAGADLASLRNADNMLKLMRSERDKPSGPMVVLSMLGVPKRPEIPLKDFSEALCTKPVLSFSFEPELFAKAEANGERIYETMPDAKAALQLDALATLLTGREAIACPDKRERSAPKTAAEPSPPATPDLPVLELVQEAPPPKRRASRSGFIALQAPLAERKRSSGLVRLAAAVLVMVITGVWYVQYQENRAGAWRPDAPSAFRA